MTPLHLQILIHYYSSSAEFGIIPENPTQTSYAYELAKIGFLFTPKIFGKTPLFEITGAGTKAVQHLLKVFGEL